ncbi:MAG: saccharopine dehydrogenase NADP-binding domain-containing protein [Elusimicrobia bacterium]|nr:saccharopine dehydrogenase NADP-binding domain-containing protein [Elusimicrobiota bacterium]
MSFKVGVLGGLGLMAEAALYDLARRPEVSEIVAADLHLARKEAVLSKIPNRRKIRVASVDLTRTAKAAKAMRGVQVLINAAWYEFNLKAMDLALALRAHYLDLGGLYHMTLRQLKRDREFSKAGLLGLLGCGSTPGITNMMVARMSKAFDRIDTVSIFDASYDPASAQSEFLPPFSIRTMLDEYLMPAWVLEKGRIIEIPAHSRPEPLEFRRPIGKCSAGAVIHSEAATLPGYLRRKGVRSLAFKIAYPDAVKAQLALLASMGFSKNTPLRVNGSSISPRGFITSLAQQGAAAAPPGRPADLDVLRVRMHGRRSRSPLTLEWDCEILPTQTLSAGAVGVGFTASIAAQMIVAGKTQRGAGICGPESGLRVEPFFAELAARKTFKLLERTEAPLL